MPTPDSLLDAEAHEDPIEWAGTFMAHRDIGLGCWAIIAMIWEVWGAAALVTLIYLVAWEGTQMAVAHRRGRSSEALYWDALLDTVAVALGCFAAAALVKGMWLEAVGCWWGGMIVVATGWIKRKG